MRSDVITNRTRGCRRSGCRWPATATLSFRYDTKQAWLLDLAAEPHPSLYDLCPEHADALTVPRGWERVDRRSSYERAGDDLPVREHTPRVDRYQRLREELPSLAAAVRAARASSAPAGNVDAGAVSAPAAPGDLGVPPWQDDAEQRPSPPSIPPPPDARD